MINTLLIGFGYWGKIIHSKLSRFTNCYVVKSSANNINKYFDKEYTAVFICTPTNTHYDIVIKCINNNIKRIFCEKPFTGNTNKARELLQLASENNINIYIDNVFLYRTEIKNISQNCNMKTITFVWNKYEEKVDGKYKDNIINTLLYHDLYMLISITNSCLWSIKNIDISNDKLYLVLHNNNCIVKFKYNRQYDKKIKQIYINDELIDMSNPTNDPLSEIISQLCSDDYIDYNNNNRITLDAILLMNNITYCAPNLHNV